ncbi:hypothetical protein ACJX0J_014857, partial [Zea mays]
MKPNCSESIHMLRGLCIIALETLAYYVHVIDILHLDVIRQKLWKGTIKMALLGEGRMFVPNTMHFIHNIFLHFYSLNGNVG